LVAACPHQDAVQPALEAIGLTEAWQIAPGADERFLGSVIGSVSVAEDQPCGAYQPREGAGAQDAERLSVTMHCPFNQLAAQLLFLAFGGGARCGATVLAVETSRLVPSGW